jgi:hypothetical protein
MFNAHRRIVLVAFAVLAIAALVAIPAFGSRHVKIGSKLFISTHAPAFHGHVNAPSHNHGCEPQRTVKLYKQKSGPDKALGKDRTNNRGQWSVGVHPLRSGAYYAKVRRLTSGAAGTIFVCRKDRSRTLFVD